MLGAGVTTYLFSKEIWVIEHDFPYIFAIGLILYGANKKFGAQIRDMTYKMADVSVIC